MRNLARWLAPATVLAVVAPAGCGGAAPAAPPVVAPATRAASAPQPASSASTASTASTANASSPSTDAHTLPRSAVRDVVARGLGAFLQHIELDDQPVRAGGKFHGFRVALLRGDRFWDGVDLKPGDVITTVNGFPIERPEQALMAFQSLDVASELRVAYDRDGQSRELAYGIVDDK
jgi:type II secretory pathway component PulC